MPEDIDAGRTPAEGLSDGQLDCCRYSHEQLQDLLQLLDEARFPLNVARIREALAAASMAKASAPTQQTISAAFQAVRFTDATGWLGWLAAKRALVPFYGQGSIDATSDPVVLAG